MGSAPDELTTSVNDFLIQRGHEERDPDWLWDGKKKQCPECYGLHGGSARECDVCGWFPQ